MSQLRRSVSICAVAETGIGDLHDGNAAGNLTSTSVLYPGTPLHQSCWSINSIQDATLTTSALSMAINSHNPTADTIIHSDHAVNLRLGHLPTGEEGRTTTVNGQHR